MILSALVIDAYRAYRGKSSNVPQSGSDKYNDIVAIANRKQREWANDANMDWPSLYQELAQGDTVDGTQTYSLPTNAMKLSDYVILTSPTNNYKTYIKVIKSPAISRYDTGVYVSGNNPKQITFIQPISGDWVGQSITVPAFIQPADLVNPTDTIAVDSPEWLVYATAYELARNDYARMNQAPVIKQQADGLYANMVATAQNNSFLQPNEAVNNMTQRISGFESGYNGYNQWGSY